MKEASEILSKYGKSQSFEDTALMLLSNRIDFGGDKGGMISVKRFHLVVEDIKALMKIAYEFGASACSCGGCDFCTEFGPDYFEGFIERFHE